MTKDLKKSVKKEDQMSSSKKEAKMKTKDLGVKEFTKTIAATDKVVEKLAYADAYSKIENIAYNNEDTTDDLVTRREDGELVKVLRDSPPLYVQEETLEIPGKKVTRAHVDPDILEIGGFEAGTRVPEAYAENSIPIEVFHFIGRCAPDGELYGWLLKKAAAAFIHGRRIFLHVKPDETGEPLIAYDIIEDIKATAVAMKATEKQLEYLKNLGYNGPMNITKREASELIEKFKGGYVKKTVVLPDGKIIKKVDPKYALKEAPPEKEELELPDRPEDPGSPPKKKGSSEGSGGSQEPPAVGITERSDPALDKSWVAGMANVKFAIIITKNPGAIREELLQYRHKTILHATVTGFGGTILEPGIQNFKSVITDLRLLVESGFPADQIVIRVDPIIPTPKGLQRALDVINHVKDVLPQVKRLRYSFLDMYTHVKERFEKAGIKLPWSQFHAPEELRKKAVQALESVWKGELESCGEGDSHSLGCISAKDAKILGIDPAIISGKSGQRELCLCPSNKKELLDIHGPCAHGCLYCYWKTPTPSSGNKDR